MGRRLFVRLPDPEGGKLRAWPEERARAWAATRETLGVHNGPTGVASLVVRTPRRAIGIFASAIASRARVGGAGARRVQWAEMAACKA